MDDVFLIIGNLTSLPKQATASALPFCYAVGLCGWFSVRCHMHLQISSCGRRPEKLQKAWQSNLFEPHHSLSRRTGEVRSHHPQDELLDHDGVTHPSGTGCGGPWALHPAPCSPLVACASAGCASVRASFRMWSSSRLMFLLQVEAPAGDTTLWALVRISTSVADSCSMSMRSFACRASNPWRFAP